MADQIYIDDFDYFKGARVLHTFEFQEPQIIKDDFFADLEIHALAICDYEGEETMLFYFDNDLEIIHEKEFMIPNQAKEQASEDFKGIDIVWKNR
jgi:hypothetical protein